MKNLNLKSILLLVMVMTFSVVTYGQQDHSMMNMKHDGTMMGHKKTSVVLNDKNLNGAYMHYTMINNVLIKADTKKVQMMSKMLVSILNSYGKAPKAVVIAGKLAANSELDGQRKLFSELTIAFEPLLKGHITKGEIYKKHCPMANGSGAYWFSNSENGVNPYLGSDMASCGQVKETFKVN